jgi:hypothetical protein
MLISKFPFEEEDALHNKCKHSSITAHVLHITDLKKHRQTNQLTIVSIFHIHIWYSKGTVAEDLRFSLILNFFGDLMIVSQHGSRRKRIQL